MRQSLDKGHLESWWKDSFMEQVLPFVLSRDEIEELRHGRRRFARLRSMLEVKVLQECQPILSGEAAAHFSLTQAIAIQEISSAAAGENPRVKGV
jgi:hypothetical protein